MKRFLAALLLPLALVTVAARRRAAPSPEHVTFDKEIVRIFQQHCQDVSYGEASTDEMCLALVGYVVK